MNNFTKKYTLYNKGLNELRNLVNEMTTETNQISVRLVKQLKQKDKLTSKLNRNCDVLTAMLQARSLKRSMYFLLLFFFYLMKNYS